jgi:AcrR family transcriptional regulator
MSPQHSNRGALLEGTLRCLERLPPDRITARAIAAEAGANVASINYHFGSKDRLVTEAVVAGLDRWLDEVAAQLAELAAASPAERLLRATEAIEATRNRHAGLARNYLGALARSQHNPRVREILIDGFRRARENVATVLDLGTDDAAIDTAGLVHAMFTGLLFASLLDPALAIEGKRMERAQGRLREALPL